jgi:hypothetical protein
VDRVRRLKEVLQDIAVPALDQAHVQATVHRPAVLHQEAAAIVEAVHLEVAPEEVLAAALVVAQAVAVDLAAEDKQLTITKN